MATTWPMCHQSSAGLCRDRSMVVPRPGPSRQRAHVSDPRRQASPCVCRPPGLRRRCDQSAALPTGDRVACSVPYSCSSESAIAAGHMPPAGVRARLSAVAPAGSRATLLLMTLLAVSVPMASGTPRGSLAPPAQRLRLPAGTAVRVNVHPRVRRAPFINDDALNKLMRYGYLPQSDVETGALRDESQLTDAIRQFQRYAHIPETGVVDELTRRQFGKPRCGLPDVPAHNGRYKRYALQGQTWEKTDLTWTVASHTNDMDSTTVYHELAKALKIWSDASVLTFTYIHSADADIIVSFHSGYHQDGYPFDGTGQILAHAFFPGTGRGGDAHFDEGETWVLNHEEKSKDGVSLFAVAAHEFGHSLGLSHSSRQSALMFPWYQSVSEDSRLPDDDRLGLQQMYGAPRGQEPKWATNPYPPRRRPTTARTTTTARPTRRRVHRPPSRQRPDPCDTHYDAISVIRGETFVFSGQYFWRINQHSGTHKPIAVRISNFWYGLPENLTKIDAIYEQPSDSSRIVIFTGRDYWLFNGNSPEPGYPQPLTTLGLPYSLDSIDAAMVWGHNGKTYFFKNDMYWRFDEATGKVELDYPRDINVWHGVPYHLDAAFQYGGITYFFKQRQFWTFDDLRMRVASRAPSLAAVKWMGCPLTAARSDKLAATAGAGALSLSHASVVLLLAHLTVHLAARVLP